MMESNRRQFLWRLTAGIGVVCVGNVLTWVGAASPDSPRRKTPNGDFLETVPQGGLPSFAEKKGPKVQEAYRYAVDHAATLCSTSRAFVAAKTSVTATMPTAISPRGFPAAR